jgi:hypothetical protein
MPKTAKATLQRVHVVGSMALDGRQTCLRCGTTITEPGKPGFDPQAVIEETVDGQTRFRIWTGHDADKDAVPCDERSREPAS